MKIKKISILIFFLFFTNNIFCETSSIYIDFRNQKISDIIYSLADLCGESVFVDETVSGTATFHFEDENFEKALKRFSDYCQLYVDKDDNVYKVSKVKLKVSEENKISVNTENVLVEAFLNLLSRELKSTIMFDSFPNIFITIRVQEVSLEDILNLVIVKLPGFVLERISSGYYLTKSSGNFSKRNLDVFTISEVNKIFSVNIQKASFTNILETLFKKGDKEYSVFAKTNLQLENLSYKEKSFDELLNLLLEQANCDYTVQNGIYYIFEIQKKDITKNYKDYKIIELKNISTENLIAIIPSELNALTFIKTDKNSNRIILSGSQSEIKKLAEFIEKADTPFEGRYYKRFELEKISVKDCVASIPKNLLFSDLIILNDESGFITQVNAETEKELEKFIALIDSKKITKTVTLKYIKSEELIKNLPPCISKENIIETTVPTSVFFSGTENLYNNFLDELKSLDVPKQQIKYQLLVIQRQKTSGVNLNSSFSVQSSTANSGYSWSGMLSNVFNINFDIISQFGVQFAGNLNAEISEGKSHVLADTTLNGISGEEISFSNTNTYRYRDIIVDAEGDIYTSTTREISSGLTLKINGWVSGDDMITVEVDAQVSKQGSTESSSTSTDRTNPPSTSEKKS